MVIRISLFILACLMGSLAHAQQRPVRLNAVTVIAESPQKLDAEFVLTNEGSSGDTALVRFIARSNDGLILTKPPARLQIIPVGKTVKVRESITRPSGSGQVQTDQILAYVTISGRGAPKAYRETLQWTHVWPLIKSPVGQNDDNFVSEANRLIAVIGDKEFDLADAMVNTWAKTAPFVGPGIHPLANLIDGLQSTITIPYVPYFIGHMQSWQKARPQSPIAPVLEAMAHKKNALLALQMPTPFHALHQNALSIQDPYLQKLVQEQLDQAAVTLKRARPIASGTPLFYSEAIEVAILQQKPSSEIEAILNEGLGRYPSYVPLYITMLSYYGAPGSQQNIAKAEKLIQRGLDTAVPSGQADMLYAQLYSYLGSSVRAPFNLFAHSSVKWPRYKKGSEEIYRQSPTDFNLNVLASDACLVGDRETYLKWRPQLRNRIVRDAWHYNISPDLCDKRYLAES